MKGRVVPEIRLSPLTPANARAVVRLAVAPTQAKFVASNADSIADAYVHRELCPLAIYAVEELVGFAMYGQDPDDGRWWIIRMMIDERFQGHGYGRGGLEALIRLLRKQHSATSVTLGVNPANRGAIGLYESLGFRDTGEVHYDEMVMRMECDELKT